MSDIKNCKIKIMTLNKFIDHTLLRPDATLNQVVTLCQEAVKYNFCSVCVNPYYVKTAADLVKNSTVKVCTVVGFPLGASTKETKRFEAEKAISDGAFEIDMVLNISAVKAQNWDYVSDDLTSLVEVCHQHGVILKLILETCLLNEQEKINVCKLAAQAKVDFVKTSTGFSTGGATIADVKLMRSIVGPTIGVKASGGIRDNETAMAMIAAGANRLGTSASVEIVNGSTGEGY